MVGSRVQVVVLKSSPTDISQYAPCPQSYFFPVVFSNFRFRNTTTIETMENLKVIFSRERTVGDVEKDFHRAFPHLKLELFNHGHDVTEGSPISDRLDPKQSLASLDHLHEGE